MSELGFEPPRRRGRALFWTAFLVLIGTAAALLFWPRRAPETQPADTPSDASAPASLSGPVTLYFGDAAGRTLVTERRDVPAGGSLEARVEAVVQALVAGPDTGGAVRTLPAESRLRRVFYDDDMATVFLDFTPTFVTRHPGGSAAEYATITSILRTLGTNFSEITRVQFLVDGQPIETLAGHFDTSKPIEIASWQ